MLFETTEAEVGAAVETAAVPVTGTAVETVAAPVIEVAAEAENVMATVAAVETMAVPAIEKAENTEALPATDSSMAAESVIELHAQSAVLMDGGSGRILYDKNGETPLPMASTTKIMTCILALEYMAGMESATPAENTENTENAENAENVRKNATSKMICTVSANAASQPEVKLGMSTGDTYYLSDLLYSLMLESHNDTAVCIAETVGGSVEGFAALMNAKAAEIGCTQTYYITPNGLDAEDENGVHHTTAQDLALVMRYCLTESSQSDRFLQITQTSSYTFTNIEETHTYSCTNHNAFLNLMEGAISGKTGFTGNAGYCYVGALERDGKLLIVALLACGWPNNKGYKWVDTKKLMNYGLSEYELVDITDIALIGDRTDTGEKTDAGEETDAGDKNAPSDMGDDSGIIRITDVPVTDGQQERVATVLKGVEPTEVLMRADEQVEIRIEELQSIKAPVAEGTQVGLVHYLVDGTEYAVAEIVTAAAVEKRTWQYCLRELVKSFLGRLKYQKPRFL